MPDLKKKSCSQDQSEAHMGGGRGGEQWDRRAPSTGPGPEQWPRSPLRGP